jgi:preprotein translocase subunit YajC
VSLFDILPILAIVGVMYFLLLRPQSQERAAHEAMLAALQRDDRVVTVGGVHGKVCDVGPATVTLEIGEKLRVTFEKTAIARKQGAPPAPGKE